MLWWGFIIIKKLDAIKNNYSSPKIESVVLYINMNIFQGEFGVWLSMIITLIGYRLKLLDIYLAIRFGIKHGIKAFEKEKTINIIAQ